MDWITGIRRAIDFIEENLTGELDYGVIAGKAYSSVFQFQRVFGILCGCTLGEYIRARRLTLAGGELSGSDARVIDVALKYGYDSPESFARAFVKFHGITPSEAKRDGSSLKSFSRLKVKLILEGGSMMEYKVEKRPAFRVVEKVEKVSVDDEVSRNAIPDFWSRSRSEGILEALCGMVGESDRLFGICYSDIPKGAKTFEYAIGALYDGESPVPEGFRVNQIPAGAWAVFRCTGAMPGAIQDMFRRIYSEFFPASEYQPVNGVDFEVYPEGDMSSPDYKSEIWIPVEKR